MSRNWTEDQFDAIRARGGTLLVSAAAGSGKTAVLVQRALERITDSENPTDADRLLVVTFTKAAASEMKSRIAAALARLLEEDSFNARLQRQQLLLSRAHISTIDSFCMDLVRGSFFRLGVSPDVRVLEESEVMVLRSESAAETLEEYYAKGDASFYHLVETFSSSRDDEAVAKVIGRLYDFIQSHPFPERWLAEKTALYETPGKTAESVWGRAALSYAADAADYCVSLIRGALDAMAADETMAAAYGEAYRADLDFLGKFRSAISGEDWDTVRNLCVNYQPVKKKQLRGYGADAVKERVSAARDEMKSVISSLKKLFCADDAQCRADVAALCPVVKKLFEVTLRFTDILKAKKEERRAVDFNDLEHLALRLLVRETPDSFERTPEAGELAASFDEVMVDEYQDTNETQDMIFRAVSQKEKNLFLVGDVKQSIYRFRQAMPQIFLRRRAELPPYDRKKDEYPACVVLDRNFRSRAGVTDAVNFVFRQLMSRQTGELDYTGAEELVPAAAYPPVEEPDVELDILDLSEAEDEEKDSISQESRRIAELIYGMMDGKPRVTENGKLRPAVFRDFCILLRAANRPAHEYVRELTALGIPAWADTSGGFFANYEVGIALSLLRVLDNPLQDIPLLSVLMSPIYGFTPDDMARLRLRGRSLRLYQTVVEAAKNGDEKSAAFLRQTEKFRTLSAVLPADRLIRTVFEETGLFRAAEAMPNGSLRLANLRLLLSYAKKYEASGFNGLGGFLRFLDRMQQSGGDLSAASSLTESENVVRVMSIHHSKGLEFPICIVAGCARTFNRQPPAVLLHPELGLGAYLREDGVSYDTLPREAVALETRRDEMSEELRVLYVAMTRAKEKLVLLATLPDANKRLSELALRLTDGSRLHPYAVRSAKSISDWLLLCALRHPDGAALRKIAGVPESAAAPAKERWDIRLISPEKEKKQQPEEIPAAQPDAALEKRLASVVNFVYPYAALRGVCAKAAVSELAEHGLSERYAAASRPAFLSQKGLTPAEKGTALHACLQYMDYKKAAADPAAELERLVEEKYITREQAKAADLAQLREFLTSSLMKRILDSPRCEREVRFSGLIPAKKVQPGLSAELGEEKVVLQGAVDLVFEEGDSLVLVDFKTDRTADADELWARYQGQLTLYRGAMERCFGKKVKECLLYSFHLGCEVHGFLHP